MDQFRQSLAGRKRKWSGVWEIIKRKGDSLIAYFRRTRATLPPSTPRPIDQR